MYMTGCKIPHTVACLCMLLYRRGSGTTHSCLFLYATYRRGSGHDSVSPGTFQRLGPGSPYTRRIEVITVCLEPPAEPIQHCIYRGLAPVSTAFTFISPRKPLPASRTRWWSGDLNESHSYNVKGNTKFTKQK